MPIELIVAGERWHVTAINTYNLWGKDLSTWIRHFFFSVDSNHLKGPLSMQSKHPIVLWGHFKVTIYFNEEILEWDGEVVHLRFYIFVYWWDRTVSKGFPVYEGECFFLHVDLDCSVLYRVACGVCSSLKVHGQGIWSIVLDGWRKELD